jgi:DNA ligase-1
MNKTIFKKDSKEKFRFLTISTEGNKIIQVSGLVDSPNPVTNISECRGKNTGKANETTAEQQAVAEATAKIKKKLEEGYYESIEEAEGGNLVLPMLAKDFVKEEKKVVYPALAQPKLDGMRCLKTQEVLRSRKNKVIDTMAHIASELNEWSDTFDGELYAHGDNFQRNMELIKKYRPGESETVKYHVYDMVLPNLGFMDRYIILKTLIETCQPQHIELVPTVIVNNKEELLAVHKENLELGYEGTMVRWGNEGYQVNKRSSSLLKFKDFEDIACTIVDVEASEKRPDQGIFICALEDGRTFGCGMRFSHEQRAEFLSNKQDYIGQTAEVRFFEYSTEGIPRFPVAVGIRLDK